MVSLFSALIPCEFGAPLSLDFLVVEEPGVSALPSSRAGWKAHM